MLPRIYGVFSTIVFIILFPLLFPVALFRPSFRYRLGERFARYRGLGKQAGGTVVWIHASSVGEVQAARALMQALDRDGEDLNFVLSVMTEQGHRVACRCLAESVSVIMAPLDAGCIVRRALRLIRPDLYICLETELWPAVLLGCRRSGVKMALLNGRLSERSLSGYLKIPGLMRSVVRTFDEIGVITAADRDRFLRLGADSGKIHVTGNSKYDLRMEKSDQARSFYRGLLGCGNREVFICGSIRHGEERMLLRTYRRLRQRGKEGLLLILAPRHLERLPGLEELLRGERLAFDRFSELGSRGRRHRVIVVDTMGELARLYAAGDYIFLGGSLVNRGGHNLMEAAFWGKPVYYGPFVGDYSDAAALLEAAGAGFPVADHRELGDRILEHMNNADAYRRACRMALEVVAAQRGAAGRQARIINSLLCRDGRTTTTSDARQS